MTSGHGLNTRKMQVEELAKEVASGVEATEPGVLKYQWFKTGTPQEPKIVVWEVYVLTSFTSFRTDDERG